MTDGHRVTKILVSIVWFFLKPAIMVAGLALVAGLWISGPFLDLYAWWLARREFRKRWGPNSMYDGLK